MEEKEPRCDVRVLYKQIMARQIHFNSKTLYIASAPYFFKLKLYFILLGRRQARTRHMPRLYYAVEVIGTFQQLSARLITH